MSFSSILQTARSAIVSYPAEIRSVGTDFFSVYRNHFFHWNLSKLAIFAYAFGASTLFSLPFLAGIAGIGYYAYVHPAGEMTKSLIDGKVASMEAFQIAVLENLYPIIAAVALFVLVVGTFSFFITYGYFLLSNVYRSYLEGSALSLKKNLYFDRAAISKFFMVVTWISLYLLAVLTVGALLFVLAFVFIVGPGGAEQAANSTALGAATLAIVVTTFLVVAYYALRTGFSTAMLLSDTGGTLDSGRSYVRRSLSLTRGKFLKVVFLVLPFAILIGIGENLLRSADESLSENRMYQEAVRLQGEEEGADEVSFLKSYVDRSLETEDLREAVAIFSARTPAETGIDRAFFSEIAPFLNTGDLDPNSAKFGVLFGLLNFFLFDGIIYVVYLSIFVRIGGSLRRESGTQEPSEEKTSANGEAKQKAVAAKKRAAVKKAPAAKKGAAIETEKPAVKKPKAKKPRAKASDTQTKKVAPAAKSKPKPGAKKPPRKDSGA